MNAAQGVFLFGVAVAIAVIAGYLIWITLILKHVVNRLVTILGAVDATTETAQPAGAIIDDLNRDLEAGRKLMEDCVRRLEEASDVPVGATAESTRHPADGEDGWDDWGRSADAAPAIGAPGTEAEPREVKRGFWNR